MAAMLETPSRIWRRIEAIENRDMPSLPSLPPFEDSDDVGLDDSSDLLSQCDEGLNGIATVIHSTPAATSHGASTFRAASSTSSTARFARSIASRSTKSSTGPSIVAGMRASSDSFEISGIPSIPKIHVGTELHSSGTDSEIEDGQPDIYLPPQESQYEDDDLSISDALQSISRSSSPAYAYEKEKTPMKSYDYSASLKSEPKPSPLDKFRNISLRRPPSRIRTPSLTHTLTSTSLSSTNDTPHSSHGMGASRSNAASPIPAASVPLPPSRAASESPAVVIHRPREDVSIGDDDQRSMSQSIQMQSMDITDVQISPPQLGYSTNQSDEQTGEEGEAVHSSHANYQDGLESQETDLSEPMSGEEPDPTFSSDAEPTSHRQHAVHPAFTQLTRNLRAGDSIAESSPAQSVQSTPTPAFFRPRARFNIPEEDLETPRPPGHQADEDEDVGETVQRLHQKHVRIADDDLMTPHSRRRSFLLSVINSTTRPRLNYPAPHPRRAVDTSLVTPAASVAATPATNLRTRFAGVTPRPRFRTESAGNSDEQTPSQSSSAAARDSPNTEPSSGSAVSKFGDAKAQFSTPGPMTSTSPQIPTENASFMSTASSHDLTTHQRVNTSFDPAMGFGAGGPGHIVGRFNAGKLNNYLHSLNRRLQEENEVLLEKLRKVQEETEGPASEKHRENVSAVFSSGNRRSSGGRRISGGTVLNDVREDVIEEGWQEEKAELEELVESYKEEVVQISERREELERNLEVEQRERERDKQRWKDRITELEEGVEVIVKDLEQKLGRSEERANKIEEDRNRQVKDLTRQLSEVQNEHVATVEMLKRAERALGSENDLGSELRESNEKLNKITSNLRLANNQIQDLGQELAQAHTMVEALERALRLEKENAKGLAEELDKRLKDLGTERENARKIEAEVRHAEEDTQSMERHIAELEDQMRDAANRIVRLEDELMTTRKELRRVESAEREAHQQAHRLEEDAQKAQELAEQMGDALEEAERKMVRDQEVQAELTAKINSLERELEREKERLRDPSRDLAGPTEADIQALEDELDAANKETARLNTILTQSPARKAVDKAKDMRIEVLEREKEELLERNKALRMTINEANTPSRLVNNSGISPIHRHVLSLSIRAPRTPGGPLKDLSWLNSTHDPSVSPLLAEINRLQRELNHANESIDDKLDKLQDAGLGAVGLTKNLEDARAKIITLEDEVSRLGRREDRLIHRMKWVRCRKCHVKMDMRPVTSADESLLDPSRDDTPTEPETQPTKTSEALRAELHAVNLQLEDLKKQWEAERRQLAGEKTALQDATDRLSAQVKNAREETRRAYESGKAGIEGELETAKRIITDLEEKLKAERKNLRALTTEQDRLQRQKTEVLSQLQRTELDMDDVRQQLQKVKQENHDLEKELRVNANAEQKARILEGRVAENLETIEHLRHERSLLAADHKQLQGRFTELTEQANQVRSKYSASSTSHEKRRHQLDLYRVETEDLHRALSEQADELHKAEEERNRIAAEKEGVARTVAFLEADLRRVKKDAECLGRDLRRLRVEKENTEECHKREIARLEKSKKQAHVQMRTLKDQLQNYKDAAFMAQEELKKHCCIGDSAQLENLRLQHNKECKGLIVQIRYLKAKFTRESGLRTNLCYQKQYLLLMLARYERSEKTILASIARIGFPVSPPPLRKKLYTLRSVAVAVLFPLRAKRASQAWREQCSAKEAISTALQEVRQRRAAKAIGPSSSSS